MKKKILIILLALICIIPTNVYAISDDYKDLIYDLTDTKVEEGIINFYFFRGYSCPHCHDEEDWLKGIKKKYGDYIKVYDFETFKDEKNVVLMHQVAERLDTYARSVPFTIIGEEYFVGYSETTASKMENTIRKYIGEDINKNEIKLPIIGTVNVKDVSIPLVAVILGFIDGFNPCAMWVLLFLINMLFGMEDKKKSWILGFTFLFISGLVYFLSMLGINFVLGIATINWLKIAVAIFILIAGILNLRKYLKIRKEEAGCSVVDSKKRKKLVTRMKKIMDSKTFILALVGIIVLAVTVNLIELACSLGFPMIFSEILSMNSITGISRIIYLLIYIFFYMIDDMVVFTISMVTLEATGITNKYNKLCTLVSSIIMIIMGLLFLIKPEWIMLNF